MSDNNSDSPSDNEWDERGELAWNEFDWEQYLREQDELIHRYIGFYEQLDGRPERLDETAHRMGWDEDSWSSDNDFEPPTGFSESPPAEISTPPGDRETDPYTLHKNPVFIATKGIFLSTESMVLIGMPVPAVTGSTVTSAAWYTSSRSSTRPRKWTPG